jgi:hypothetical protein
MRCGASIYARAQTIRRVAFAVFTFIILGALLHLLSGCGPRFTANALFEESGAGAGGEAGTHDAGGDAGTGGEPSSAAGSSSSAGRGGQGGAAMGGLCSRVGWSVSAFAARADEPAAAMLDGDPASRWASGEPQAVGQWFELELGAATVLEQLELRSAVGDMPAELALELDGVRVASTASMPAPGVLDLVLDHPTRASSARVVIVVPSGINWWSVLELGGVCR